MYIIATVEVILQNLHLEVSEKHGCRFKIVITGVNPTACASP